jgi:hypothetical protein
VRAQHVQADPRDDRGEPRPQVLDVGVLGAAEPQPGLLHGVVGLVHRAEHPVGHSPQLGPVGLEPLRQPVALVHGHIPSAILALPYLLVRSVRRRLRG